MSFECSVCRKKIEPLPGGFKMPVCNECFEKEKKLIAGEWIE